MDIIKINGSVTAPKGFTAYGTYCGIRKNRSKKDLALISSQALCDAAAVYTQNKVKGAPILVTQEHLRNGKASAILCNSGNANTCNADGVYIAHEMCTAAGRALCIPAEDVIIASTGVIGQPLPLEPIVNAIPELVRGLDKDGGTYAAQAIMTTDTHEKSIAVEFNMGGRTCRIGAIAKGSGMINPNMATMLCFITTDVNIDAAVLSKALKDCADTTFNMVSVDGDTSTNDMVCVLASGLAQNARITGETEDYAGFCQALESVMKYLAREIARDGEGATKLIECRVSGARDYGTARAVAKTVISSNLFKAAIFGSDANWGRVLCAIGYAPADIDVSLIDVTFESVGGAVRVCKKGRGLDFDEDMARSVLVRDEVLVNVNLNSGESAATAWGCDLTYDYVKINGDYRS